MTTPMSDDEFVRLLHEAFKKSRTPDYRDALLRDPSNLVFCTACHAIFRANVYLPETCPHCGAHKMALEVVSGRVATILRNLLEQVEGDDDD